jgi:hypothetical protein
MVLLIDPAGRLTALYDESLDLAAFGPLTITRASFVEPDARGHWHADLTPVSGPVLGPFGRRSEALEAERAWLEGHLLAPRP